MAKLTEQMKLVNSIFGDQTFRVLKEGGIWAGDEFQFKKVGDKFYAVDKASWAYAQKTLSPLLLLIRFDLGSPIYKAPAATE